MDFYNFDAFNSCKRLPIVFCLDVSPSMGFKMQENSSSIELLNSAVKNFITEIKKDVKARSAAEISFVTFSTNIEMNTDFKSVKNIEIPEFTPVKEGGTNLAGAIMESINKIEKHRRELEDSEIGYYAPFLVLVTDGDPDQTNNSSLNDIALKQIQTHCDSHIGASEIIVPFIIGVGDHINPENLNNYSKGFTKGYFPIKGNTSKAQLQFNKVFQLIGNSTKKSIHLNGDCHEAVSTIQSDMNDLLNDLAGE